MSILIVDDEKEVRDSLAAVLVSEGYEVIMASDANEALDRIERYNVTVMLLDLSMPGMGGRDLLENLSLKDKLPPSLIISALAPWQAADISAYGVGYMRKPVNNKLLLGAIRTLSRKEFNHASQRAC